MQAPSCTPPALPYPLSDMRLLSIIALAVLITSCGGSDSPVTGTTPVTPTTPTTPAAPTVTTSVDMKSLAFTPSVIQVSSGAVVTFTNSDGFNHNVTFANTAVGTTGNYSTGAKTLTMPTTAGTYPYQCTLHGGMTGSVTVK